jgi:outer membrane usher protein FimD/PapC
MKFTLKTLVVPAVALCATAAFAANLARVNVPFSFTAQGQSYPAGRYQVTTDMNHNFVTLANETDANKHLTWLVGPAEAAKMPAVVTFDQTGASYYLKTVQMGDRVTPNLDTHSKAGISATTSIGGQ